MVKLKAEPTVPDGFFDEVTRTVEIHQPELEVSRRKYGVVLDGKLVISGSKGPFDSYDVWVGIPTSFPWEEPIVFETGGRIPRIADRHVFEEHGDCCLGVWEEWLLTAPNHSVESFVSGWLHDYFVVVSRKWWKFVGGVLRAV